jgi:pimeloyl-ACP methyl ester carboxylesterase
MKPIIVAGIIALIPALTLRAYFRDLKRARRRQKRFHSKTVNTAKGPVEYATAGKGEPVLVVHGAAGGYDQGITIGRDSVGDDFRIIAPSRFGYQNTPMPKDASPAAQADTFASFLEALGIPRISVVGVSAGAPSALQFAIRHPEKVLHLVLMVPGVYGPEPPKKTRPVSFSFMLSSLFKTNYPLWAAMKLNSRKVLSTIGVPVSVQQQLTGAQKEEIMNWLLPYETRIPGMINDARIASHLEPSSIQSITAPTLIISARDDLWKTYGPAQYTAQHIPHAKFIGFDTGGHLLNGWSEKVRSEIRSFLRQPAGMTIPG